MSIAEPITYDMATYEQAWNDDDPVHLFCDCDPNVAFCGEDIQDAPELPYREFSKEDVCKPCRQIEQSNLRRCPWGHLPGAHP